MSKETFVLLDLDDGSDGVRAGNKIALLDIPIWEIAILVKRCLEI